MSKKNISWERRLDSLEKPPLEVKLERALDRFIKFYSDVPKNPKARMAHLIELLAILIPVNFIIIFLWGAFRLR